MAAGSVVDGPTRYLCAAAHLDAKFAEEAIAEFLVEPVRSFTPSPGVDSAAVLREAVAARTRRRIRDAVLLGLILVFVLTNFVAAFLWAAMIGAVAALLVVIRKRRTITSKSPSPGAGGDWRTLMFVRRWLPSDTVINRPVLALVVAGFYLVFVAPFLFGAFFLASMLSDELGGSGVINVISGSMWLTAVLGLLMLVVLIVDEFAVAMLMANSFRQGSFDPDLYRARSDWERTVRSLGHDSFGAGLSRVAHADRDPRPAGLADVVVHRGHSPFVGAGEKVAHHVMALPLEPADDDNDTPPVPIGVNELHRRIAEALAVLRSPSSLSPGRRLEQLRHREQVLIPASGLSHNRPTRMQSLILPDLSYPPVAQVPLGAARALAENPLEQARYYSCFGVESWEYDLVTSCYLHIGTDQHMLYLEWTYCVLLPVSERYRSIDRIRAWRPFLTSLIEWVTLPVSLAQRLRSVFHRYVPLDQRLGEVVPDRYGAQRSLREIAADDDAQTYFQGTDIERYVNVLDRALVRAVGQYLEECGYSVVEFTRKAVDNNFNFFGDVVGSAFGKNSKVGDVSVNAGRGGEGKK